MNGAPTALDCICGSPAIVEERPHLKHRYSVRCSRRGESHGRAGVEGCSLVRLVSSMYRGAAINQWNNEVRGFSDHPRKAVDVSDGERCQCGLLKPCYAQHGAVAFAHDGEQDCASSGLRRQIHG